MKARGYHPDWDWKLEIGEVGEQKLSDILCGCSIEVKRDLGCCQTGNVFVELFSRGKPSGLQTSKADWWAFIIDAETIIIIATRFLRELVCEYFDKAGGGYVRGGDVENGQPTSLGVLVPVRAMVPKSIRFGV